MSLIEAVRDFMSPIIAEYCVMITDYDEDLPVEIHFGSNVYKTTLKDFKNLDRAFKIAQDRSDKQLEARLAKKAVGKLI